MTKLNLNGFTFDELFTSGGVEKLDQSFLCLLKQQHIDLYEQLIAYRAQKHFTAPLLSAMLIDLAKVLEIFLADLFNIHDALTQSQISTTTHNPIDVFKKYFVLKRAKKEIQKVDSLPSFESLTNWLDHELTESPFSTDDKELALGLLAMQYLKLPDSNHEKIEKLVAWCTRALTSEAGKIYTQGWGSFKIPERLDYKKLVLSEKVSTTDFDYHQALTHSQRHRDGFKLTDHRMSARAVQNEVNYCIYCHDHDGDFCSKGFPVKKGYEALGYKQNALDVTLTGCPLEEKISEMNVLKKEGNTIAALAIVMIDNPMCPATGHRICNDCMKACIYQKQEPVNIPEIETRVLTDVLDLPYGVEIYDLLTRWHPLRQSQWVMKPYNGLKILIAGMGPAGFTLAHHLLLEGFAVVGFDGLKIEPLADNLIKNPIYRFNDLKESLDERLMAGFGGVAEYGITVRWDKNFLKLIYLSLMRKPHFQVFGSVRFGGTIEVEDAWEMGFDHFVVAVGAGLPKALPIPNSMAPGMRQANDFLMALQLGNAAKKSSLTSLQIRLPAVVIGGGLTGVDTATELQAYYLTQVEKIYCRYTELVAELGIEKVNNELDAASLNILNEFLLHALQIREERKKAQIENRLPNLTQLIHRFGGVTIVYRRNIDESPAYIHNHEELQKALQEGVFYAENLEPSGVLLNNDGYVAALVCKKRIKHENEWQTTSDEIQLRAHSILVATGTQPNTAYEFEHKGTFNRINLEYQHYENVNDELHVAHGIKHCKENAFGPFTSYCKEDKRVSLIGDTHPVFHGNVVKAIASGMRTYPKILELFNELKDQKGDLAEYKHFADKMNFNFRATIKEVKQVTENVVQLAIHAPLASKHFKPGQFYRLQNFETYATCINSTLLQMEPLSLTTAHYDKKEALLTFLVKEVNAASKICHRLKKGEPVSLMGPTGVKAKIPSEKETILIIGNDVSFPFVMNFGSALQAACNHVVFFADLNHAQELYCQTALEASADLILWQVRDGEIIKTKRAQDVSVRHHSVIENLIIYAKTLLLSDIDKIYLIGDTNLLRSFQTARRTQLKSHLLKKPKVIGAVYGNMQCMLKGVCAQCLQWQIDPETGKRTKAVFACSWQDQPLELIDIDHLDERAMQNQLHDKLNALYVDQLLKKCAPVLLSERDLWLD